MCVSVEVGGARFEFKIWEAATPAARVARNFTFKILHRAYCILATRAYSARVRQMHVNEISVGLPAWDIQAARNLYSIQSWGAKYFDINEAGRVVACPLQAAGASAEFTDVIEQ